MIPPSGISINVKLNIYQCQINYKIATTLQFVKEENQMDNHLIRNLLSCHIHMVILPHNQFRNRHNLISLLL